MTSLLLQCHASLQEKELSFSSVVIISPALCSRSLGSKLLILFIGEPITLIIPCEQKCDCNNYEYACFKWKKICVSNHYYTPKYHQIEVKKYLLKEFLKYEK
jgi:hypothetical protein